MKVRLIKIGKIKYSELEEYAASFLKKLQSDLSFELDIRKEEKLDKDASSKLLKSFEPSDFVVALDEHGDLQTSIDFSKKLFRKLDDPQWKRVNFVIGGPYGLPPELMKRANEKVSLSELTFTSDLAFAIFMEQLYRAVQIKKGTGYHHE